MQPVIRALSLSLILGAAAMPLAAGMKFDDQLLVYTSDKRGFEQAALQNEFATLLRQNRPVVLFIHGRGKEPGKSLEGAGFFARLARVEGNAVPKLEDYEAKVAMFSWNSRRCGFLIFGLDDRDCPLANMDDAQARFHTVIAALANAVNEVGTMHPPITLLAHSMGTIVVERYVEANGWRTPGAPRLFTNVVLSSADADNLGHERWVGTISAVERVYVTVNKSDPTLEASTESRAPGALALGRDTGPLRAPNATYVDLDIKAHEIFTKRLSHPEIETFFSTIFSGGAPFNGQPGRFALSR